MDPSTNTTIAARKTFFAPNLSAIQPLTGMKTARETRYAVSASFSAIGLVPMSAAIAGSDVGYDGRVHLLHEQSHGKDERNDAIHIEFQFSNGEKAGGGSRRRDSIALDASSDSTGDGSAQAAIKQK